MRERLSFSRVRGMLGISGRTSPQALATHRICLRAAAIAVALLCSSVAAADPVRFAGTTADGVREVTSGEYQVTSGEDGFFSLSGDGFSFVGTGLGSSLPFWTCGFCLPGTPVGLDAALLPGDFSDSGTADLDGTHYEQVYWSGRLDFDSEYVTAGADVRASAPFTFSGTLSAFLDETRTGTPLFSTELTGNGTVHIRFFPELQSDPSLPGGPWAEVFSVRYQFEDQTPIPEPTTTTMVLIGSGLAGLVASRKRRRQDLGS
jgi:hypothetical protein